MNNKEKQDALMLEILEAVENDSKLTQRDLATSMGVALGLANSCLRRCIRKGLIKVHQAPANRYLYYVTPKGFTEKSRLTAQYLSNSFAFYRRAGDACRTVYRRCRERDWRRIVLCGYSELAEIALLRAHDDAAIDVIGIYDPAQRSGDRLGLPVWKAYSRIPEHDALILTTLDQPLEFLQQLRDTVPVRDSIFIPSVLGISKDVQFAGDESQASTH
ncbi:MAG: winged helix-turn-helix transcriptional regulator [Gammaproteobacteria bacterium]|nr:winged helix-turn-helix transcriptional regulator [Gammaproteobacteria bacterium]